MHGYSHALLASQYTTLARLVRHASVLVPSGRATHVPPTLLHAATQSPPAVEYVQSTPVLPHDQSTGGCEGEGGGAGGEGGAGGDEGEGDGGSDGGGATWQGQKRLWAPEDAEQEKAVLSLRK